MTKALITGATGNVGIETITSLKKLDHDLELFSGVRNIDSQNSKLAQTKQIIFDFTDVSTFESAFSTIDCLFLLRPPQIADVKKHFEPLIEMAKKCAIKHIVFLSVQGVEKSKIIPHHKIEKLIVESGIPYTFIRPAYFMQNFTTTLREDLVKDQRIFLPAGKAKFTIIDLEDVGAVIAKVLVDVQNHRNKSYELTNDEKLTFGEMAGKLSSGLNKKIDFTSPNLLKFFIQKRKKGVPTMFIFVMIMLHYFARFQETPKTTDCVENILGRKGKTFDAFVLENTNELL